MSLPHTRALIKAALTGKLDGVDYSEHPVFGLQVPATCDGVPGEVLDPKNTWADKDAYDTKANDLASKFVSNFEKYADKANEEIMAAAPRVMEAV